MYVLCFGNVPASSLNYLWGSEGTSNQLSCTLIYTHSPVTTIINGIHIYRDSGNGLAALVLAGPIFFQGKN